MVEEIVNGKVDSISPGQADFAFLTTGTTLFINKTVREYLSGYEDPLLGMAAFFRPDKVKSSKFSYLANVNSNSINISLWCYFC